MKYQISNSLSYTHKFFCQNSKFLKEKKKKIQMHLSLRNEV